MKCVFPGSFDPFTNGHMDIALRLSRLFDEVIIAVAENPYKKPLPIKQRKLLIEKAVKPIDNIIVMECDIPLMDFCNKNNINIIVKGIRNSQDYEYEATMAFFNRQSGSIETLYIDCNEKFKYISSTFVKELLSYGKNISQYVPENIVDDVMCLYKS